MLHTQLVVLCVCDIFFNYKIETTIYIIRYNIDVL